MILELILTAAFVAELIILDSLSDFSAPIRYVPQPTEEEPADEEAPVPTAPSFPDDPEEPQMEIIKELEITPEQECWLCEGGDLKEVDHCLQCGRIAA